MKYRFDNKEKTLSFGVWPEVSLKAAREKLSESRTKIQAGFNPIELKREKKLIRLQSKKAQSITETKKINTFDKVAHEWMSKQGPRWTEEHQTRVRRSLEIHVFPEIGQLPITEIDTITLLNALRKIEMQGKHEAASRARQRCEGVFRYGIQTAVCERNPAIDLRGALTPPTVKHLAALKPDEIPEFLHKLEAYEGHPVTRLAMWFMLYTFVRTKELRLAKWSDINLDPEEPLWIIPAENMKAKREHHVPLCYQTIDVLEQMQEFSGPDGLVFPQEKNAQKPMSENTLLFALYRMGYHSRATTHGFRATASTILNESGLWHPDAIERQLAHQEGNKVRAAYDRSLHMEQRSKMMQWWADHVDSLMIPADVIDLHTERKRRGPYE
jgi:integrase